MNQSLLTVFRPDHQPVHVPGTVLGHSPLGAMGDVSFRTGSADRGGNSQVSIMNRNSSIEVFDAEMPCPTVLLDVLDRDAQPAQVELTDTDSETRTGSRRTGKGHGSTQSVVPKHFPYSNDYSTSEGSASGESLESSRKEQLEFDELHANCVDARDAEKSYQKLIENYADLWATFTMLESKYKALQLTNDTGNPSSSNNPNNLQNKKVQKLEFETETHTEKEHTSHSNLKCLCNCTGNAGDCQCVSRSKYVGLQDDFEDFRRKHRNCQKQSHTYVSINNALFHLNGDRANAREAPAAGLDGLPEGDVDDSDDSLCENAVADASDASLRVASSCSHCGGHGGIVNMGQLNKGPTITGRAATVSAATTAAGDACNYSNSTLHANVNINGKTALAFEREGPTVRGDQADSYASSSRDDDDDNDVDDDDGDDDNDDDDIDDSECRNNGESDVEEAITLLQGTKKFGLAIATDEDGDFEANKLRCTVTAKRLLKEKKIAVAKGINSAESMQKASVFSFPKIMSLWQQLRLVWGKKCQKGQKYAMPNDVQLNIACKTQNEKNSNLKKPKSHTNSKLNDKKQKTKRRVLHNVHADHDQWGCNCLPRLQLNSKHKQSVENSEHVPRVASRRIGIFLTVMCVLLLSGLAIPLAIITSSQTAGIAGSEPTTTAGRVDLVLRPNQSATATQTLSDASQTVNSGAVGLLFNFGVTDSPTITPTSTAMHDSITEVSRAGSVTGRPLPDLGCPTCTCAGR